MNFYLSEEQRLLSSSARRLLERAGLPGIIRNLQLSSAGGHSLDLWHQLVDLGWNGLAISEENGGGGGSLLDLAALLEEAGRALLPRTFLTTTATGLVLERVGSQAQKSRLLKGLAHGSIIVALVVAGRGGPIAGTESCLDISWDRRPVLITGGPVLVSHASAANMFLVIIRHGKDEPGSSGSTVALVPAQEDAVVIEPIRGFGTEGLSMVSFNDAKISEDLILERPHAGTEIASTVLQIVASLMSVEMVGGAAAVLDRTVEYVKHRVQFGRPIGTFQAVQHQIADCAIAVDGARYAAYQAVWRLDRHELAPLEASVAKVAAADAFKKATLTAHELHGGAGYVTDNDLYLFSERAQIDSLTLGSQDDHLAFLAGAT